MKNDDTQPPEPGGRPSAEYPEDGPERMYDAAWPRRLRWDALRHVQRRHYEKAFRFAFDLGRASREATAAQPADDEPPPAEVKPSPGFATPDPEPSPSKPSDRFRRLLGEQAELALSSKTPVSVALIEALCRFFDEQHARGRK